MNETQETERPFGSKTPGRFTLAEIVTFVCVVFSAGVATRTYLDAEISKCHLASKQLVTELDAKWEKRLQDERRMSDLAYQSRHASERR